MTIPYLTATLHALLTRHHRKWTPNHERYAALLVAVIVRRTNRKYK